MPVAEILSQGDEIVTGQTIDTNAAWLAERLIDLGFEVRGHTSVGDRLEHIQEAVTLACGRSDLVLSSGGLGPTDDDLTAAAVAAAAGVPLDFDVEAMRQIERMFQRFGKVMADSNRKQALLPRGSQRLDNRWGTAPGFAMPLGRAWIACVPGVPREMRKLFDARVVPMLERRFALLPGRLVTLRTAGVGESRLQQLIGDWHQPGVTLGFRTMPPENQVKLRFAPGFDDARADQLSHSLADLIGAPVFAREGVGGPEGDLPTVALGLLRQRGWSLAVAERGSGGSLLAMLYSTTVGVAGGKSGANEPLRASTVRPGGSGSESVSAMAADAREQGGADLGLALELCADPDSPQAGQGEVALDSGDWRRQRSFRVVGGRDLIRTLGAGAAVDFLRRQLSA